jgi:trk system potassium uptake protein TrkA
MSDIIIIGCGRVGSQLASRLSQSDNNVTVIDRDIRAFSNLGQDFNGATIQGVGFDEDVLIEAGVRTCDAVAAVTQLENTNLMIAEV